jgi:hypothetical protein
VGPFPDALPAECTGLVHGTLARGATCRSSLDCPTGFGCRGAGPTESGRCSPPAPAGELCDLAVDTLATFTRQEPSARECRGYCERHRCRPPIAPGGACTLSRQCGAEAHCSAGRCVAGRFAPAGGECSGGDCAPGSRCVQGRCREPSTSGACASDFECSGGCVKGRCAPRCDMR